MSAHLTEFIPHCRHPHARIIPAIPVQDPLKLHPSCDTPEETLSLKSSTAPESNLELKKWASAEQTDQVILFSSPIQNTLNITMRRVKAVNSQEDISLGLRSDPPEDYIQPRRTAKRTKYSILSTFLSDDTDKSASMFPFFEQMFGETLFDNSIIKSPTQQVDLTLLNVRKFKSYRRNQFTDGWSSQSDGFEAKHLDVKSVVSSAVRPLVTRSKTLALLALMPSQAALDAVLDQNSVLVSLFFDKYTVSKEGDDE